MAINGGLSSVYLKISSMLRKVGLLKPVRQLIGPTAGRIIFKIMGYGSKPMEICGHQMYLASVNRYPPMSMVAGKYEEQTTELIRTIVRPGMVVLDVGAHVGYYSLLMARNVGSTGKVYCFEPEPMNYSVLERNIQINGYRHVITVNKAVSDMRGNADLFITGLDNGRNSLYKNDLPVVGSIVVQTISIDEFLDQLCWPQIDLVKLDVEGSEPKVWRGMNRLIENAAHLNIIMEFNPVMLMAAGEDPVEFLSDPIRLGCRVQVINEETGLTPVQIETVPQLTKQLLDEEKSANIFCSKGLRV